MDPQKEPSPLKQIRTFQGDIAEALHHKQASVESVRQAEKEKIKAREILAPALKAEKHAEFHEQVTREERTRDWKKMFLLLLGTIVLLGLGATGTWYAYTTYKTKSALPVIIKPTTRFVSVGSSLTLDVAPLTHDSLVSKIEGEESKLTPNTVEQILIRQSSPSTDPITTQSFMTLIGAHAPAALVRSFDPLYMLGILGGTPTHLFLIIKLDSFENAFPGMLTWEGAMPGDLLPIISPSATVDPNATWSDITIENQDARILTDTQGQTVLLYSFFNDKYLIITDNETSLRSIIQALEAQSLAR